MSAADLTIPLILLCAVALALWVRRQVRTYNQTPGPVRIEQHIPAEELALTGDDYRKCVEPFFRGQVEHDARLAYALDRTCFSQKSEDRIGPGPLTAMEVTHARRSQ